MTSANPSPYPASPALRSHGIAVRYSEFADSLANEDHYISTWAAGELQTLERDDEEDDTDARTREGTLACDVPAGGDEAGVDGIPVP